MSVAMLVTKTTATAGIRNSNLVGMAHKNGGICVVGQVFSVLSRAHSIKAKKVLTHHVDLDMEEARG